MLTNGEKWLLVEDVLPYNKTNIWVGKSPRSRSFSRGRLNYELHGKFEQNGEWVESHGILNGIRCHNISGGGCRSELPCFEIGRIQSGQAVSAQRIPMNNLWH